MSHPPRRQTTVPDDIAHRVTDLLTDQRSDPPAPLARGTARMTGQTQPAMRVRARGTPRHEPVSVEQLRTMIYAPDPARAGWIESELARAPISITIQVGRRVRTVVAALIKDPPPRPELLIVDFDAISPAELFELHAIRHAGWPGRLIGLGRVPAELRTSLGVEHAFAPPFVRDSLLDCVAGTSHATVTAVLPVIPPGSDDF